MALFTKLESSMTVGPKPAPPLNNHGTAKGLPFKGQRTAILTAPFPWGSRTILRD